MVDHTPSEACLLKNLSLKAWKLFTLTLPCQQECGHPLPIREHTKWRHRAKCLGQWVNWDWALMATWLCCRDMRLNLGLQDITLIWNLSSKNISTFVLGSLCVCVCVCLYVFSNQPGSDSVALGCSQIQRLVCYCKAVTRCGEGFIY